MFFSAPSPLLAVSHCILPNACRARITTPSEELMPQTVVLEKTLESPLDCKEIQPVHSKGDQS